MARILLADEDKKARKVLSILLKAEGHEVDEKGDGEEALDRMSIRAYDLVVADCDLPKLDGIGLLQEVKTLSPEMPVFLMTSQPTIERCALAVRHGANHFMSKPVHTGELLDKLQEVLRAAAGATEGGALPAAAPTHRTSAAMMLGSSLRIQLELICREVRADGGEILLKDDVSERLVQRAASGAVTVRGSARALAPRQDPASDCLRLNKPVRKGSELYAPIGGDPPLGVAHVVRRKGRKAFLDHDMDLLAKTAGDSLSMVENAQAYAVLGEEKEKLETVFEQAMEGFVVADRDRTILMMNPRARLLLGFPGADPGDLDEAVSGFDVQPGLCKMLFSAEHTIPFEMKRTDPKLLVLSGHLTRIEPDRASGASGYFLVFRDVTLEKREEMISRGVLSFISHKLRTPLAIALGNLDILGKADKASVPDREKILETIKKQLELLNYHVDKLLLLAAAHDPETLKLEMEVCRPLDVVEEAIGLFELTPLSRKTRIDYEPEAIGELQTFQCDRHHIAEAVKNLLTNAAKFNKAPKPKARIEAFVTGTGKDKAVRFSVTDNGPGVPDEDQPKIFEKFYQIDEDFTGQIEGMGLGLAFVKHIAEAHGGKAEVRSMPGHGSTFTIELPWR